MAIEGVYTSDGTARVKDTATSSRRETAKNRSDRLVFDEKLSSQPTLDVVRSALKRVSSALCVQRRAV